MGAQITPAARVADRQLSFGGKADPSDQHGFAARLLSPAAKTRHGSVRRLSPRVRHGLGVCRSHRQQFRRRHPRRYINAYQEVQPLTIGELWAVSITLQIVLIENLRRLAQQITRSRNARHEADRLADRLLGVSGRAAEPASIVFAGPWRAAAFRGVRGPTRPSASRSGPEGSLPRWLGWTSGSRNRA